ncbi:hypothetical protein C3489_11280 [Streptomyces sp. Ru71]|uniref:hypothetical protein n=1 Tax=Streptomyces sp. Ru71 TaxID=2080746 RepID=UPI000CDD0D4A|nr:hypothetical protein [Streptomyces sp. Ru71]POX55347.1 hypothetical protein C3489_11280 [Streptomyces sp. Ru71]
MDGPAITHALGLNPADLEPAPPPDGGRLPPDWADRLRRGLLCIACATPASYTTVRAFPGLGYRWIDVCGPHLRIAVGRGGCD